MAVYHNFPRKSYYADQKCTEAFASYSTSPCNACLSAQYRLSILTCYQPQGIVHLWIHLRSLWIKTFLSWRIAEIKSQHLWRVANVHLSYEQHSVLHSVAVISFFISDPELFLGT